MSFVNFSQALVKISPLKLICVQSENMLGLGATLCNINRINSGISCRVVYRQQSAAQCQQTQGLTVAFRNKEADTVNPV